MTESPWARNFFLGSGVLSVNHLFRRTLAIPLDLSSATLVSRETLWHSSCLDRHMGFPFRVRVGRCLSDLLLLQDAESCYLAHSLLKFYLDTVFENYYSKIAKLRILREFSILTNNFHAILSKLQPSVSRSQREPGETVGLRICPSPTRSWLPLPTPSPGYHGKEVIGSGLYLL